MLKYLLPALAIFLVACGADSKRLGPVTLGDATIFVETRPNPPTSGMVEFILIASRNKSRPVTDYVVSFRTSDEESWKQAIQDGFSGVYRRAVRVNDAANDVLQVMLKKKDKEIILKLPLREEISGTKK